MKKSLFKIFAVMITFTFCLVSVSKFAMAEKDDSKAPSGVVHSSSESMTEKVSETKESIEKDLNAGISSIQTQVKDLTEKAKKATGQAKRDLNVKIEELNEQEEDLKAQVKKLKSSTGLAWQDLKSGAKSALESIKKSVQDAKERFK